MSAALLAWGLMRRSCTISRSVTPACTAIGSCREQALLHGWTWPAHCAAAQSLLAALTCMAVGDTPTGQQPVQIDGLVLDLM